MEGLSPELISAITEASKLVGLTMGAGYLELNGLYSIEGHEDAYKDRDMSHGIQVLNPLTVKDVSIQGIGAEHFGRNFVKNQALLQQSIAESNLVTLEAFGPWIRERAKPDIDDQSIIDYEKDGYVANSRSFFVGVGRECAIQQKDVLVVNPESRPANYLDAGLLAVLPTYLLATHLQLINPDLNFLDNIAWALEGATLGSAVVTRPLQNLWESRLLQKDIPQSTANRFGWNFWDYRDIRTAQGVRQVIEADPSPYKDRGVLLLQGAHHNGVIEYLQKPNLAKLKSFLYPHYHLLGDRTLRQFHFDKNASEWIPVRMQSF